MDCILNKDDLLYVFKKEQCIDLKEEELGVSSQAL